MDGRIVNQMRSAPRPRSADDLARIERARAIWDEARDPRGTLVEAYFCIRRLTLDDGVAGRALRFHPRCPWRNENTGQTDRVPALIAAFRSLDDDEITAIHRIALTPTATSSASRMLGLVRRRRSSSTTTSATSWRSARASRPAWPPACSASGRPGRSARSG